MPPNINAGGMVVTASHSTTTKMEATEFRCRMWAQQLRMIAQTVSMDRINKEILLGLADEQERMTALYERVSEVTANPQVARAARDCVQEIRESPDANQRIYGSDASRVSAPTGMMMRCVFRAFTAHIGE